MGKKGIGKLVAFAAITGAAAAGISYFTKYKSFHKELEKDFREYEDGDNRDEDADSALTADNSSKRNYVSLHADKDEFKAAAKDMAGAAKSVLKDAGAILSDTAHEAASAAVDTARIAINSRRKKTRLGDETDYYEEDLDEGEAYAPDKEAPVADEAQESVPEQTAEAEAEPESQHKDGSTVIEDDTL